jgi:uncharacterized protein (TIGR03083 family)
VAVSLSGHDGPVEAAEHIRALRRDGEIMAAAARQAGLTAAVPSCPGWQVRDLLRHTGYVHRWAASYVANQLTSEVEKVSEAEQLSWEPPDADLLSWFSAGHAALADVLTAAPADVACWTFLRAPSPLAFWARRQAHETAIHRVDAELARGRGVTEIDLAFAADGVDELITGFLDRNARRGRASPNAHSRRIRVHASDAGAAWQVGLTPDGQDVVEVSRRSDAAADQAGDDADCTVTGPAAGLYLLLWNRADPATAGAAVSGDASLLRLWREGVRVTW